MNEMAIFCLQGVNYGHVKIWRHISEDLYDGRLAGILYDGVCSCFCRYIYTVM